MRLDRVEIEDFRAIDRLRIDLDDLTTVIGEHDRGKSSLLRAIGRVLGPRQPGDLPAFGSADFHRPGDDEAQRAMTLSITMFTPATGSNSNTIAGSPTGKFSGALSAPDYGHTYLIPVGKRS